MNLTDWFMTVLHNLLTAIYTLFTDFFVFCFQLLLTVILSVLSFLPAPAFMQAGGLQTMFNNISPDIWYFAHSLNLGACLAMFGAAAIFRLSRKVLTLFQW